MGNVLGEASAAAAPDATPDGVAWVLVLDCHPDTLQPLLVCHDKQIILKPSQIHELVHLANSPRAISDSTGDVFGELPHAALPRAARIKASQLMSTARLVVPPDDDAAGIESVPVSTSMLFFGSKFGHLLVQFACRARRIQLDLVALRARKSLLSHPTTESRDRLKKLLVENSLKNIPGERGTTSDALQTLKMLRNANNRDLRFKSLITEAIAANLEMAPYGMLAIAFVDATSPSREPKSEELSDQDVAIEYFHAFWKNVAAGTTYSGLRKLQREGKMQTMTRIMLALCASTASLHVVAHTASILFLIGSGSYNSDPWLPWQALNSLNSIISSNNAGGKQKFGDGVDGMQVADPSGPGVRTSVAFCWIVRVLKCVAEKAFTSLDENSDGSYAGGSLVIGLNSESYMALLELFRRVVTCYFSQCRHRSEANTGTASDKCSKLRSAIVSLHKLDSLPKTQRIARRLLKIVNLVLSDTENVSFRKLNLSASSMQELRSTQSAFCILQELGFSAEHDIKKEHPQTSKGYLTMFSVDMDMLKLCKRDIERVLRDSWAIMLPDLLYILHCQVRLMGKFRAYPNSRDPRDTLCARLHEFFDDLICVTGMGFDTFQESEDEFRSLCSKQSIGVLCDGLRFFLPKASDQVSFLSRLFNIGMPLTPSSYFKRDLSIPESARKEMVVYLFVRSCFAKNSSHLTDLAFGQDEDLWAKLVLDIWKEAPEHVAWKRVCRVITDMQMNDSYFERYKNDPVISPILNRIMRVVENDVAPMKMSMINEALVREASKYPKLASKEERMLGESTQLGELDNVGLAQSCASLLFSLQRDLFTRSIVDGCRSGAQSIHPVLEFVHLFLRSSVHKVIEIINRYEDGTILTFKECGRFRDTLEGAYLPHILMGIYATMSQFHPENKTLSVILDLLNDLNDSFGNSVGLNESEFQEIITSSNQNKEYDYSSLEEILDAGGMVEDLLVHPDFAAASGEHLSQSDVSDHRRTALKRMRKILSHNRCPDELVEEFEKNSGEVLAALEVLQDDPQLGVNVLKNCKTLFRITYFIIFGRLIPVKSHIGLEYLQQLELPSLTMCYLCGKTFIDTPSLVDHTLNFKKPSVASRQNISICTNYRAWFSCVRHMIIWTISKVARSLVSGSQCFDQSQVKSSKIASQDESKSNEWIESALFKGGLELNVVESFVNSNIVGWSESASSNVAVPSS